MNLWAQADAPTAYKYFFMSRYTNPLHCCVQMLGAAVVAVAFSRCQHGLVTAQRRSEKGWRFLLLPPKLTSPAKTTTCLQGINLVVLASSQAIIKHHIATMTPASLISIPSLLIFMCLVIFRSTAWSTRPLNTRYQVVVLTRRLTMVEQDDESEEYFVDVGSKHFGYNVLGTELSCCCSNVDGSGIGTGFYRNGFCGKLLVLYVFLNY